LLVYLILFISDCLTRIQAKATVWSLNEAGKQLQSHAVDNFALPGEPGFPINEMYDKAANRADQG
jgi:actin related protein 2/3 complex subunit 3